MKLSVVIPGYNVPDWKWRRCVKSVVAAAGKLESAEVICIDDGSKACVGGLEDLSSESVRVSLVRFETNKGLPTARNYGMTTAHGEYVTFVDSDDEVRVEAYLRTVARMTDSGSDVGVFGVNVIFEQDHYQVHDIPDDKYYGELTPADVACLVKRRLFYYSWNKVFRRSYLEKNGFQFFADGVPCEDAIFNVQLVERHAKWITVGYEGYVYYRYDGSLLSSYKSTLVAGMNMCTKTWKRYKDATPGAYEALGSYEERSPEDVACAQWWNIWRRGAPYTMRMRWQFAKNNKDTLGRFTLIVFCLQAFKMFIRTYFYVAPIRRWIQKRNLRRLGAIVVPFEKRCNMA